MAKAQFDLLPKSESKIRRTAKRVQRDVGKAESRAIKRQITFHRGQILSQRQHRAHIG